MRWFYLLWALIPVLVFAQDFQIEKVQYLVYERNWKALEQNLNSGEIVFPEGDRASSDFILGYSLLKQGKTRESIEPLTKAAESASPLSVYAHYYLGKVYADLEYGASAEEHYLKVSPASPLYLQSKLSLIEQYLKAKKIEPAATEIYQLRQSKIPDHLYPEFLFLEAEFYRVQNQPGPALEKQIELYMNFPASVPAARLAPTPYLKPDQKIIRARRLMDAGRHRLAKEELKELKAELKAPEDKILPQLLGLLARAYFSCNEYSAVISLEKDGKKYASKNPEFWFYLAWAYHRLGKDQDAQEHYHRLLQKFPQSDFAPRALYHLARMAEAKGELNSAQDYFEKLSRVYPESEFAEEASFQTGLIFFRQRAYGKAAEIFNKALPRSKNQDQFLYWLAKSYDLNDETEKASQLRQQLIDNFPVSAYTFLSDPNPKPFARSSIVQPSFSMELPTEFSAGLSLARLGFLDLAQDDLNWQLKQKSYPFQTLVGLANKLIELKAYCLIIKIYYNYIAPSLTPEQKISYIGYLYPRAFSELVEPRAHKYKIDLSLAYALMRAESNFHPGALSSAGAIGLTQVMPFVADATMRKMNMEKVDRIEYYHPELNIEIGFYHLNELQTRYQLAGPDPWPLFLTLCAYNAGTQAVNKWFEEASKWAMPPDLWLEMLAYPETKSYLKRILAGIYIYRQLYPEQASGVD